MSADRPRIAVVTFPGSLDDRDALWALGALDADAVSMWHAEPELPPRTAAVVLPGGFSYGDYLRPGALARFSPAPDAVARFAAEGGLVLGICNGFQILCEAGRMPHPEQAVVPLRGSSDGALVLASLVDAARVVAFASV